MKTYPLGDVWDYFCEQNGAPVKEAWFEEVRDMRPTFLVKREAKYGSGYGIEDNWDKKNKNRKNKNRKNKNRKNRCI